MINDLLNHIDGYNARIGAVYARLREEYADEDEADDDPEDLNFDGDAIPEDDLDEFPAVQEDTGAGYGAIPEEVFYDETEEIIGGNSWTDRAPYTHYYHLKWKRNDGLFRDLFPPALRYSVSPDNPWYFDIDGVVFSRETGLLVQFPGGMTEEYAVPDDERITGIAALAFSGCDMLKRIVLNDRIRYIGDYAFMECSGLQEIIVPAGVEHLGKGAFAGCDSLKTAVLDCSIPEIPYRCFIDNTSLESVVIPPHITAVGGGAFSWCAALSSVKPSGTAAGSSDVILPSLVKEVGTEAFSGCSTLHSVCAESVEQFGAFCFRGCTALERFTFGKGTRKLGRDLFLDADNLKEIRFSCAPNFVCSADALPTDADYSVDAEAYLSVGKPYSNKPLFLAAVRSLAYGEAVSALALATALKTLKRNRTKHYDWFLQDEQVLEWVLNADILGCGDHAQLLGMADKNDPEKAEMIREHMYSRFSEREIAVSLECSETMGRGSAPDRVEQPDDPDIPLERMNLSARTTNYLKQHAIRSLSGMTAMLGRPSWQYPNLGRKSREEIAAKVEELTGIKVPEKQDDTFTADDCLDLNLDDL